MLKRMLFPGVLLSCCVMLSACATTTTPEQQPQEVTPVAETAVVEEKAANPCEVMVEEAVQESRKTMKSTNRSCEGNTIEVTPMWSLDYKGAVHLRVFDANGGTIKDEIIN